MRHLLLYGSLHIHFRHRFTPTSSSRPSNHYLSLLMVVLLVLLLHSAYAAVFVETTLSPTTTANRSRPPPLPLYDTRKWVGDSRCQHSTTTTSTTFKSSRHITEKCHTWTTDDSSLQHVVKELERRPKCFGRPIHYEYYEVTAYRQAYLHLLKGGKLYERFRKFQPSCWSIVEPIICSAYYRPCHNTTKVFPKEHGKDEEELKLRLLPASLCPIVQSRCSASTLRHMGVLGQQLLKCRLHDAKSSKTLQTADSAMERETKWNGRNRSDRARMASLQARDYPSPRNPLELFGADCEIALPSTVLALTSVSIECPSPLRYYPNLSTLVMTELPPPIIDSCFLPCDNALISLPHHSAMVELPHSARTLRIQFAIIPIGAALLFTILMANMLSGDESRKLHSGNGCTKQVLSVVFVPMLAGLGFNSAYWSYQLIAGSESISCLAGVRLNSIPLPCLLLAFLTTCSELIAQLYLLLYLGARFFRAFMLQANMLMGGWPHLNNNDDVSPWPTSGAKEYARSHCHMLLFHLFNAKKWSFHLMGGGVLLSAGYSAIIIGFASYARVGWNDGVDRCVALGDPLVVALQHLPTALLGAPIFLLVLREALVGHNRTASFSTAAATFYRPVGSSHSASSSSSKSKAPSTYSVQAGVLHGAPTHLDYMLFIATALSSMFALVIFFVLDANGRERPAEMERRLIIDYIDCSLHHNNATAACQRSAVDVVAATTSNLYHHPRHLYHLLCSFLPLIAPLALSWCLRCFCRCCCHHHHHYSTSKKSSQSWQSLVDFPGVVEEALGLNEEENKENQTNNNNVENIRDSESATITPDEGAVREEMLSLSSPSIYSAYPDLHHHHGGYHPDDELVVLGETSHGVSEPALRASFLQQWGPYWGAGFTNFTTPMVDYPWPWLRQPPQQQQPQQQQQHDLTQQPEREEDATSEEMGSVGSSNYSPEEEAIHHCSEITYGVLSMSMCAMQPARAGDSDQHGTAAAVKQWGPWGFITTYPTTSTNCPPSSAAAAAEKEEC